MYRWFLCALICFLASPCLAATYYVHSVIGNDSYNGSAMDSTHAFQTITKAAQVVQPGDTVIIQGGPTTSYGHTDIIYRNGTAANPIVFQAVGGRIQIRGTGTAASVVIPKGTAWTLVSGHTYKLSDGTFPNGARAVLRNHDIWFALSSFCNNVGGHSAEQFPYWWCSDTAHQNINIYSPTDPSLDEWVVVPTTANGLLLSSVQYIVLDGFDVEYFYEGIRVGGGNVDGTACSYIWVKNSLAAYNGLRGFAMNGEALAPGDHYYMENDEAHHNGEHGFKASGATDCGPLTAGTATCHSNYFYTGDISHHNCYDGFQTSNGSGNVFIDKSISYDNGRCTAGQIDFCGEGYCSGGGSNFNFNYTITGSVTNSLSYYDEDITHYDWPRIGITSFNTTNLYINGNAFLDGKYGMFFWFGNNNLLASNNYVSGNIYGLELGQTSGATNLDAYIYNNDFVYNLTAQIHAERDFRMPALCEIKNNVIVGKTGQLLILLEPGAKVGSIDYNAYYSPDQYPFEMSNYFYDWAGWRQDSHFDSNSVFSDFRGELRNIESRNYHIGPWSTTLKDAGTSALHIAVPLDFDGIPRPQGAATSIGAYEELKSTDWSITFGGGNYNVNVQ